MSFVAELWELVFTPGTTPALVKATHGLFVCLMVLLAVLIVYSGSIHFINLFVIAGCLWAAVTWFILELEKEKAKLKLNKELGEDGEADDSDKKSEKGASTARE